MGGIDIQYSTIIPVYKNEESIPRLFEALEKLSDSLDQAMEVVFVVDGSPDQSFALIKKQMAFSSFPVQLIGHSRNFGSFPAIRTGLKAAPTCKNLFRYSKAFLTACKRMNVMSRSAGESLEKTLSLIVFFQICFGGPIENLLFPRCRLVA